MPISASQIVQVNPRLLQAGGSDLEFNGLLLSKSDEIPVGSVLAFAEPSNIADYFGADSIEAKLSDVYFLGYTNSFAKPKAMYITRRIDVPVSAWIRGGEIEINIYDFKMQAETSFELRFAGESITVESLDFSTVNTWSDVGVILQDAIHTQGAEIIDFSEAVVTYSSLYNSFKISSGLKGRDSSVFHCSGALAKILKLDEESGAILSQGSDELSAKENMENILDVTQNWVNFTTSWMPTKEEVLDFSTWASSKNVAYLFLYSDNDSKLLQSNSEQTIAFAIREQNLSSVAGQYSGLEYSAFLMGVGACIDWNRIQATITTAFKSQEGLPAVVENSTDALNLISQGMNFVGDYATRNDNFIFNYPGQMFGTYKWIDTYWNAIWLNNALQVALLHGLSMSPRTPYSEQGYTLVRAWMQDPVNRALKNGVIEPGIVLSETQKAQINREAGKDIASEVYATGYYIQVQDPGAQARVNRESPIVNLWYSYGGSINKLVVASTALV